MQAKLLEREFDRRSALRTRLSKIYGQRSDVVRGNRSLKIDDYPTCHEALKVAVSAVRVLMQERIDVLDLPEGATRSNRLLLGG